ncbi:hypothetical protein PCC9214_03263 [Planktothrix tepida]|uniref:Putative restriction endonuclease domain-containing protein n=1 Tax=Planktothrix tepida PCC 9214 TaxID=671072 RepID=A0A1J1LTC4_9CYAN|nr:Uma2 family endonuclease [Planktothrix tepida]CAD5962231.1 hypothetical protein PCC9214_03263 [Planktothrix tepida]CUR34809.1 conserved hypothetical protein [Planktothrix tepida PCC 9214]
MSNPTQILLDIPEIELPPTQDQLPCDDGIPMETARHKLQMDLLIEPLSHALQDQDIYIGGNMFVYYSLAQVRNQDFRGPDVFIVLDVPRKERKSWVIWEEGKGPDIVIELLSESTAQRDKNEKKLIYQNQMRVTEYFWYDPFNPEDWQGFRLDGGDYQPLELDTKGQLESQKLGLKLVRWSGIFYNINTVWLRWATLEGELLPNSQEREKTAQENAEIERQRAETERQRAETERQRADKAEQKANRLVELLRAAGIDPDQIE